MMRAVASAVLQADALEHALLAALPLGPQGAAGGVSLPDLFQGELQVGPAPLPRPRTASAPPTAPCFAAAAAASRLSARGAPGLERLLPLPVTGAPQLRPAYRPAARCERCARALFLPAGPHLPAHPPPGCLQVTLHEARDLPVWGFPWQSNPYCRITLGSQAVQVRRPLRPLRPLAGLLPRGAPSPASAACRSSTWLACLAHPVLRNHTPPLLRSLSATTTPATLGGTVPPSGTRRAASPAPAPAGVWVTSSPASRSAAA